jgi:hypothetical protein
VTRDRPAGRPSVVDLLPLAAQAPTGWCAGVLGGVQGSLAPRGGRTALDPASVRLAESNYGRLGEWGRLWGTILRSVGGATGRRRCRSEWRYGQRGEWSCVGGQAGGADRGRPHSGSGVCVAGTRAHGDARTQAPRWRRRRRVASRGRPAIGRTMGGGRGKVVGGRRLRARGVWVDSGDGSGGGGGFVEADGAAGL